MWCERGGQLVLRLAGDAPLQRRERGVLAHREPGAGLAVLGDVEADVAGTDRAERLEPARGVLGGVDLHQLAAQLVADRDGRVGGGVGAAGDARVDDAERDLVGHLDRRLQPGAAGLLDVGGGRLGCEPGAEHALAGEVEVARVLEHRPGHDLAEPLAPQLEPVDEAVDGGGQHLLVGDAGVDGVGPGERDAVAADDGDRAGGGLHVPILAGESPPANGVRGTSRKVDSELQHALHIDTTVPSHQRRGNTATMSDRYQGFVSTPIGKLLVKNLGLPDPTRLERWSDGSPLVDGLVVLGGEGRLAETLPTTLDGLGIASATDARGGHARQGPRLRRHRHHRHRRPRRPAGVLHPAHAPPRVLPARGRDRHAARSSAPGPSGSPSARSRASPAPSARRSAAAAPSSSCTSLLPPTGRSPPRSPSSCPPSRPTSRARSSASVPTAP